jgi:hypothetical protein
MSKGKNL